MRRFFYFHCMKRKMHLLISFLFLVAMFLVMRWHGQKLLTPQSRRGIIDLELAKTSERFYHLQLFWSPDLVLENIYLDFLFIFAYGWFLFTACKLVNNKWSAAFSEIALSACAFDILENFLMILVVDHRFSPSILEIVFYGAAIKFIMIGIIIVYLLLSFPFAFKKKT